MYISGDYYITCSRTGFKIRLSEAVVDGQTGLMVKRGWDDAKHPLEQRLTPRKPYVPSVVQPESTDTFLTTNQVTVSDL